MTSTLSSKGQLTIPKKVREHLQLKKGDSIYFAINNEGNVVMGRKENSLEDLWSILPTPEKSHSIEEMNEEIAKAWAGKI